MCEKQVLHEVPSFRDIFHVHCLLCLPLPIPKFCEACFIFPQDYVFSYPDSLGRPTSYLAIAIDIKHNL